MEIELRYFRKSWCTKPKHYQLSWHQKLKKSDYSGLSLVLVPLFEDPVMVLDLFIFLQGKMYRL